MEKKWQNLIMRFVISWNCTSYYISVICIVLTGDGNEVTRKQLLCITIDNNIEILLNKIKASCTYSQLQVELESQNVCLCVCVFVSLFRPNFLIFLFAHLYGTFYRYCECFGRKNNHPPHPSPQGGHFVNFW